MQSLIQDFRLVLRVLTRNPGSSFVIVGLLSLGLGSTTVMFGLFDATFLRTLPVRHPEELVRMVQRAPKLGTYSNFPYAYYEALHDHATTLAAVFGGSEYYHFRLTDPEPAEEITVHGVTPEYFEALGVRALYGRVLFPTDATEAPGMPPAVLSYGFWQRRFGGDPAVVNGRTLLVNGHRFAIVGVMPHDFNGLALDTTPDVRVPLRAYLSLANLRLDYIRLEIAGRLKPGFTRLQAEGECRALYQSSMRDYLQTVVKLDPHTISELLSRGMGLDTLDRGVSVVRDRYADALKLLMASVSLLVLIICANVGGLLLARAAAREQEIAVRLAVGATRMQLVRRVFAESFLLAAPGVMGGFAIALAGIPAASRVLPPIRDVSSSLVALSLDANINWRVFLFLLALSLFTVLLFSLSPALAVSRSDLDGLLRAVRASGSWRGRQALITFQIAFCTLLLVIASLFVRTLQQLHKTYPGFDSDHIETFTINLAGQPGGAALLRRFSERVRELPGVVSVATSSIGVMREHGMSTTVAPAGQRITRADFLNCNLNDVSPGFFATMGMRILAGRDFIAGDTSARKSKQPEMIVINQAFAQRFFPNIDPVGKRFGFAAGMVGVANEAYEIVGVVSDAKYRSLREPIKPMFYILQADADHFVMYVRTRMRPESIIEPVRKVLASLDPSIPFLEVHTLAEEVDNTTAGDRLTAALSSLFGFIAALLAGAGIYGLLAYVVTERRREIGIRMALGAQPAQIGELIARQTLSMTAVGVTLGLGGALMAGPGIRSLLYGISPQDPRSLIAAVVLVFLTAALGTIIPALRATRVDPMVALRYE
jgi:predicted permease